MIAQPLISICIPAYNASKYIVESVNSILRQSYQNLEIIIVNDGSTDDTLIKIQNLNDHRIKIISQDNMGQCNAANNAFNASKGEYIKFFDADDILSPDFIQNQFKQIENTKDEIASAKWGRFYNDDLTTFNLNPESVWKDMDPINWLIESLVNGPNMMQCGLWLIPRKILNISGLWDERLSLINDFEFFIRVLLASKKIRFTENAILYYRSGVVNSLSNQLSRKGLESALLSTKLGVEHLLKFENSKRTQRICANCLQNWNYIFYPQEMDLYREANELTIKLGGSDLPFDAGGKTKWMKNLLGWKLTKKLKTYFNINN